MTDKPRDQGKKANKMLSFTNENRDLTDVMEVVKAADMHSYSNSDGGFVTQPQLSVPRSQRKGKLKRQHREDCGLKNKGECGQPCKFNKNK